MGVDRNQAIKWMFIGILLLSTIPLYGSPIIRHSKTLGLKGRLELDGFTVTVVIGYRMLDNPEFTSNYSKFVEIARSYTITHITIYNDQSLTIGFRWTISAHFQHNDTEHVLLF